MQRLKHLIPKGAYQVKNVTDAVIRKLQQQKSTSLTLRPSAGPLNAGGLCVLTSRAQTTVNAP